MKNLFSKKITDVKNDVIGQCPCAGYCDSSCWGGCVSTCWYDCGGTCARLCAESCSTTCAGAELNVYAE